MSSAAPSPTSRQAPPPPAGRGAVQAAGAVRVRPNLHTVCWAGLVLAMGYAGAVQSNGAAYLLAFLTGTLGLISWVHARGNLRGLEVRVPQEAAGAARRLVELRTRGAAAWAVELLAEGASKSVFVENLGDGRRARLALPCPAGEASPEPTRLLLRSAYPLGLFLAQRVVELPAPEPQPPRPAGRLPLPAADPQAVPGLQSGAAAGLAGREGDDFAGVREWQPGDSPRHIDWRAVARGRPLLVKTWSQGGGRAVPLRWESVALPEAQRAAQLARWIEHCEQQRLPYSLELPDEVVPAGSGAAHARRCRRALGRWHAGQPVARESRRRLRLPASHELSASLPAAPLALLSLIVLLAALMLWGLAPAVGLLLLAGCLLYRNLRGNAVRQRWLPMAVALSGIAGLQLSLGSLLSLEAGMGVLLILLGGKLLESRSPHDFQVIAVVGWFLCLCGLLGDQSLERSVAVLLLFACLVGCMVRFRRGAAGLAQPVRLTGRLLGQALPLTLLLFFLFPRVSLDSLARIGLWRVHQTGVPSSLDPGRIAELARSTSTAFRVSFPDGVLPPNAQRYWRCVVLWNCDGLSWTRGGAFSFASPSSSVQPGDVRQILLLEPHGQQWLPALEYPVRAESSQGAVGLFADRTLGTHEPVRSVNRLEIVSRPQLAPEPLFETARQAALQVPARIAAPLRELVREWRRTATTDEALVQAALHYLRTQAFEYSLEPGTYLGSGALEEFLLRRRVGFCEHFSAAFATLMRLGGVPSRVVMGYLGGEPAMGGRLIVRQSDAHAWTEVWLEKTGWTRIDPTAVLAPARLDLDLQSFLLGDEAAIELQRSSLWWQTVQQARLFWDDLNFRWYNTVISFDEESQIGWLSWLGFGAASQPLLLLASGLGLLVGLGLISLWLRRRTPPADPWARAWLRFCRRLEKLGLPARLPQEGPLAYAQRVAPRRPDIQELARVYAANRYGPGAQAPLRAFGQAVRRLR